MLGRAGKRATQLSFGVRLIKRMRFHVRTAVILSALILVTSSHAYSFEKPLWIVATYISAQHAVGLKWHSVSGALTYKVYRKEYNEDKYTEIAETTLTQYLDRDIKPSEYSYRIDARFDEQYTTTSDEQKVTTIYHPGPLIPPEITEYDITHSKGQENNTAGITLNWTDRKGSFAQSYYIAFHIYRASVQDKAEKTYFKLIHSTSEKQYTDEDLDSDTFEYHYVVTGLTENFVESEYSNRIEVLNPLK